MMENSPTNVHLAGLMTSITVVISMNTITATATGMDFKMVNGVIEAIIRGRMTLGTI